MPTKQNLLCFFLSFFETHLKNGVLPEHAALRPHSERSFLFTKAEIILQQQRVEPQWLLFNECGLILRMPRIDIHSFSRWEESKLPSSRFPIAVKYSFKRFCVSHVLKIYNHYVFIFCFPFTLCKDQGQCCLHIHK